jgi:hypothetical protein
MNINSRKSKLLISFLLLFFCSCDVKEKEHTSSPSFSLNPIPFETTYPSAEPNLFTDSLGNIYLTWIEKNGQTGTLKYAKLVNNKWTEPVTITSGENWFINWADFPQFITNGKNDFLASTLVKRGKSTYAYDIHLYQSQNGINWKGPIIPHDDGKEAEHGFVSMAQSGQNFMISWLDGRNSAMSGEDHEMDHHGGAMTLRGGIFDYTGNKISEWELDNRVCDCCQTGTVQTKNGPVVIYRDRSEEEIRDISIVRFINNKWTSPKPIYTDNWKINGCPVNGPKLDTKGNTLAIAWYSEPNNQPEVKVIFSTDGGETFKEPVKINDGKPTGRVDICLMDDSSAWVSWIEKEEIKIIRVTENGKAGKPITISGVSQKRTSGFPQMTKDGNALIFAWTDDKDSLLVKTARVKF